MKTVLITGGSQGIGLEAVRRYVSLNCQVITCSRHAATWRQRVDQEATLASVNYFETDVADEQQVSAMFAAIAEKYGRIDIAVNNASPKLESCGKFDTIDTASLKHTLTQDLWSQVLCLKHELALMPNGGAIVNISSINGLRPTPNAAMYSACKHGLEGLTRSVALEAIDKGVRVNAVAPGATWTPRWEERTVGNPTIRDDITQLVPMQRFGTPSEIVDAIEFLTSDKASYIVGHTLVVDGGVSLGHR